MVYSDESTGFIARTTKTKFRQHAFPALKPRSDQGEGQMAQGEAKNRTLFEIQHMLRGRSRWGAEERVL